MMLGANPIDFPILRILIFIPIRATASDNLYSALFRAVRGVTIATERPMQSLPLCIMARATPESVVNHMGDFVGYSITHHIQILRENMRVETHRPLITTSGKAGTATFREKRKGWNRTGSVCRILGTGQQIDSVEFFADKGLNVHVCNYSDLNSFVNTYF